MKNLKKKLFTFFVAVVTALTALPGGVAAATTTVFADELPDAPEDAVAEAGVDLEVAELAAEEQDAALLQDAEKEQTTVAEEKMIAEDSAQGADSLSDEQVLPDMEEGAGEITGTQSQNDNEVLLAEEEFVSLAEEAQEQCKTPEFNDSNLVLSYDGFYLYGNLYCNPVSINTSYAYYYTTDGTEPSAENGTKITASNLRNANRGITESVINAAGRDASGNVTIKVVAVKAGFLNSKISTYTIKMPAEGTVLFADQNLKTAIGKSLGKESGEDYTITEEEMLTLTELDLSNQNISNLSGLSKAQNLQELNLSNNPLGDDVRYTNTFNNVLSEVLTLEKLVSLDLSKCRLGENYLMNDKLQIPSTPSTLLHLMGKLPHLETLKLSGNKLVVFSGIFGDIVNVKEVDVSDNHLSSFSVYDSIEKLNLSKNNIFWDERDVTAAAWMEHSDRVEVDKSDMNSLCQLRALYYISNGQPNNDYNKYKPVQVDLDTKIIDLGTLTGGELTIALCGYQASNTVKATIMDQKFTVMPYQNVYEFAEGYNHAELTDLENGDYALPLEIMHISGETDTYTLKFTMTGLPEDSSETSAGIKDIKLHVAVCTALGKDPATYVVSKEDMASLKTLSASGVKNAEGLQYAVNLTGLSINGTYTVLPDISSFTGLTTLTVNSPNLEQAIDLAPFSNLTTLAVSPDKNGNLPDISVLENVKTLSLSALGRLSGGKLPDVSKMKNLSTLVISGLEKDIWPKGLENCQELSEVQLVTCPGKHELFTNIKTTKGTFKVNLYDLADEAEYSFANAAEAGITSLQIQFNNAGTAAKNVHFTGIDEKTPLTSFDINGMTNGLLPDTFGKVTTLTNLTITDASSVDTLPDSLAENTSITRINITNIQSLPQVIGKMKGLTYLSVTNAVKVPEDMDFSGTALTYLRLYKCNLQTVPAAETLPDTLETLDLNTQNISAMKGDYSKLVNLKTLNLSVNCLYAIPEALGTIPNLETLNLGNNTYGSVAPDILTKLSKLKSLTLGQYLPVQREGAGYVIDPNYPDTKAAVEAADALIKENGGTGAIINPGTMSMLQYFPDLTFAALSAIESSDGVIAAGLEGKHEVDIHLAENQNRIVLKPVAVLPDTVIEYNGKEYKSGEEIAFTDLSSGVTTVELKTRLVYEDPFGSSRSKTYTINLYGGSSINVEDLEEGKTYQIDYKLLKTGQDAPSMSAGYFTKKAIVRKQNDQFEIRITTSKSTWISDMDYYNSDGVRLDAELIAQNKDTDHATYRMYTKDLNTILQLSPFVVPMGYYPICDVVFDLNSILDVSDLYKEADKVELDIAINKAAEILEQRDVYTTESREKLADLLEEAKTVSADRDAAQETVDNAQAALQQALEALEVDTSKLADKISLEDALSAAKALEKGKHTDTNWEALQEAIADAQAVYDDLYATDKEAAAAAKALNNAVKSFNSSGEASTLNPASLKDGVYSVYVDMINAANPSQKSMSDGAVTKPMTLTVKDGEYTITTSFHGLYITLAGQSFFGYLKELSYQDGVDAAGKPIYKPVTVDTTYDVVDDYNDADGDGKADFAYPHQMSFPLVNKNLGDDEDGFVHVQVFVPIMEAIAAGSGTQQALMKIDWSSLAVGDEAANEAIQAEKAKNELNETLAEVKNVSNADGVYTTESFEALTAAIAEAEAVLKNPEAGKAEIEAALAKVAAAKEALAEVPAAISLENATVMNLSNKTYTGKAIEQAPLVIVNDKALKAGVDYEVSYANNINVGTATVTVSGKGAYTGTAKATFKINAAKQTATVKAKTKSVRASKLKKKAQVVKGAITIKKVKGKKQVTYTKVSKGSSKKLTINKKTGKITVKKGTKKGTYKIKVKVKVADKNKNYKTVTKTVTVKVKVK